MLRNFEKIRDLGVVVFVLALIPWMLQDFVSSLAATQMTAHTTLRTTFEKDDARLTKAFESARRNKHVEVSLVTEQDPEAANPRRLAHDHGRIETRNARRAGGYGRGDEGGLCQ